MGKAQLLMLLLVRLLAFMLELEMRHLHRVCGTPYLLSIAPCAVCYTDFWSSYPVVLPSKRHRAVGKDTGLTSYPIAIQLHHYTTSVTAGSQNLIVLEEVRKSHWSNLVVYPPLQCFSSCTLILSSLGLPKFSTEVSHNQRCSFVLSIEITHILEQEVSR